MVRRIFAQRKVLDLYQKMDVIQFPIQPDKLLPYLPHRCRILTYKEMAEAAGCSPNDVALMCKSNSGATHYDIENNRYLILYNETMNQGRILWTLCHEIGHICLDHLETIECMEIANKDGREPYDQYESEADYFAWNLIAPMPIMREMGIRSTAEIRVKFGLSTQAAALQFDRYTKWCQSHIKTAWENHMLREFHAKYVRQ
jgi:Zn-dependent peptidase ImmA (M78 family)